jgi:hypothetical protein
MPTIVSVKCNINVKLFRKNLTCLGNSEIEDNGDDGLAIIDVECEVLVEEHGHQQYGQECMLNGKGLVGGFVKTYVMSLDEGLLFSSSKELTNGGKLGSCYVGDGFCMNTTIRYLGNKE